GPRRPLPLCRRKPQPAQLSLPTADLQSFLSSHSLHSLGVHFMPLSTQQCPHSPIPVSRMVLAQAHNLFLKASTLSAHRVVAIVTRSGQSKRSTGLCRRANPGFVYQLHCPSLG